MNQSRFSMIFRMVFAAGVIFLIYYMMSSYFNRAPETTATNSIAFYNAVSNKEATNIVLRQSENTPTGAVEYTGKDGKRYTLNVTDVAEVEQRLIDAGINLHEGLLPLENRSLEEGISLAVDELNLISRKDAVKYIVFLLNEVGDEDQLALAKLSQEHPDFHLLVKLYPSEEEASTVEELMGIIRDDLIRTVKAGSYVESRLAKNFALMEDPSVTSLTVGGTTLQAEYGDVEYGETCCFRFGDKYELHYYGPEETDYPYFVLKIGEDKLADTTLTLRFQVKLVYPEYPTQAGVTTYGTYDPYGLSGYEGIAVTGETRLVALNASGKVESTEFFRVPTVSYTALLLEGQYGNEEVHYFTSDMAGTEYDYQLDDQSWHVSVFTDGMNTILDIE